MFKIDQPFPHFTLEVYRPSDQSAGKISTKQLAKKWLVLFYYPADFTFVCPTELTDLNRNYPEFKKYGAQILAVSTDTVYTHKAWLETEKLLKGVKFPLASDHNGKLSRELEIYNEETGMARRAAFIIDPDGILRAADVVSDSIGRSAAEILRKLKALYFVKKHPGNVCPASWEEGETTIKPSIKKAGEVYKYLAN